MKVELATAHFIHGNLHQAGTVLDIGDYPINGGMRPLDDEAEAALKKYYVDHPYASLNPVKDLPMTMGEVKVVEPINKEEPVKKLEPAAKPDVKK